MNTRLLAAAFAILATSSAALAGEMAPAPTPAPAAPAATPPVPAPTPATPPTAAPAASSPTGAEAVSGSGWSAEVAPSRNTCITIDDKQKASVEQVTSYFKELTTLQGRFVQTSADNKRMKGKFSLKRPGRFRFDYSLPSKQLIISDGRYMAIQDLDLENEDRISLDDTPFRLLLRSDVDLVRDACILEVQEADELLVLGLRDKSPDTPGRIKLYLTKTPLLDLKEWVTTDAQGQATRVEVSQVAKGVDIDDRRFKINPVGLTRTRP